MRLLSWSRISMLAALLATAALMAGCGGGGGGNNALVVGSDIPYTPFEFGNSAPYKGVDIDIVNEVGKRIDRKVTYKDTSFDTIFRDLAAGKFDMVASATTITPDRLKEVDFSRPYFEANQSLMVKKGSPIKTVADLDGKTVGAQKGTTGAEYAMKKTKAKDVRTYAEIDDAFNALDNGQIDAVINDFPISAYATKSKTSLAVVATIPTGESYGLAFKKGSTDLEKKVNAALDAMIKDGTYAKIFKKWFGQAPPAKFAA